MKTTKDHETVEDVAREVFVVVHGDDYIPEAFASIDDAKEFIKHCEFISGPWKVQIKKPSPKFAPASYLHPNRE